MSREKEFDQAFKDRINQMDFDFKEAYWDEMGAILDNKKKKRGALFWWISTLSVASLLLAGALFFVPNKTVEKNQNASEIYPRKIQDAPSHPKDNNASYSSENKDRRNENSTDFNEIIFTENIAETENRQNQQTSTDANSNPDISFIQTTRKNRDARINQNESVAQTNQNEIAAQTNQNKRVAQTNSDQYAGRLPQLEEDVVLSNREGFKPILLKIRPEQPTLLTSNTSESQLAQLPTKPVLHTRTWDSHVGILVGSNFGQSMNVTDGSVGGLGTHGGLRFYFAHKKGFQLNTGLSFGVNSINGLKYEEHRKVFGFTQYDLVNTIHYKSMLTAHVPLYLGYEGSTFSVAGGLRLNYIMNTKGRVYAWNNSVYDQNIWGYAHGIKHFNMGCGLESSYRFARRWDAGVSFDFDLSSRSEENNDLISPEARLWQAGIFIKYRLN